MSYSYDRYERRSTGGASSRRSALGYWLPLALTVTAATVGIVAWIWSERNDDESDDYYKRGDDHPPSGPPPEFGGSGQGQPHHTRREGGQNLEDEGMVARMSGALRRTPSPQQLFDGASRRVAAGVAAAGAAVGGALSSIREEDKRDFEDHSRWSEEAEFRTGGVEAGVGGISSRKRSGSEMRATETSSALQASKPGTKAVGKRKTVAIVVSAHTVDHKHSEDVPYLQEHASILSHLPHHIDAESRLFVLIYAPDLKQHPLASSTPAPQPMSITSSYSNIGHEDIHDHGEESHKPLSLVDPDPVSSPVNSKKFDSIYKEAQSLVDNDTMIMPFTTPTGHIHILRQLAPEVAYIQETLSGPGGDALSSVTNWVGQTILVVGDESGHGGLVDSEDERGHSGEGGGARWWQDDPRIGLGKGVEVVESLRVGEDWRRRVGGHD
ncbi:hypothetical protein MMC07_006526 [Pseudocyphellaria aurata]|nr:hypothetical protein [Pseudocyphellaria aurata]